MTENVAHGRAPDDLDPVWKALSDATRRAILDYLRDRPRTTTAIVETFPHLSRFGVMKHLDVLRQAHLVSTHEEGRQRVNSLNVVPIRQIYERWVGPFQELWTSELLRIKEIAEQHYPAEKQGTSRKQEMHRKEPVRTKQQNSKPKHRH
ncbi:MAG: helix-turn-helix domain-containing protein [Candidatus Sulfotelmatobacter sp.]